MQTIQEILEQKSVDDMIPLIEAYYENRLGIRVEEYDENHLRIGVEEYQVEEYQIEDIKGYSYHVHNAKKLPKQLGLSKKTALDAGEITALLTNDFSGVLKSEPIEYLISVKNFITQLKRDNLHQKYIADHPKTAIVSRYLDGLLFSTIEHIKEKLYKALQELPTHTNTLLDKEQVLMEQLDSIIPELSLEDLLNFRDTLSYLGAEHEETQRTLQAITAQIHKKISQFSRYADISTLHETLPSLKSQMQVKKFLLEVDPEIRQNLSPLIDESIISVVLELLILYKQDVERSSTDFHKTEKLQLIEQLNQTSNIDDLLSTIQANAKILKKNPIGRYLYECVCWFFNLKNNASSYPMTLFDTAVYTKESLTTPPPTNTPKKE